MTYSKKGFNASGSGTGGGVVGVLGRGPWAAGTTYAKGDVVTSGGKTYVATLGSTGVTPGGAGEEVVARLSSSSVSTSHFGGGGPLAQVFTPTKELVVAKIKFTAINAASNITVGIQLGSVTSTDSWLASKQYTQVVGEQTIELTAPVTLAAGTAYAVVWRGLPNGDIAYALNSPGAGTNLTPGITKYGPGLGNSVTSGDEILFDLISPSSVWTELLLTAGPANALSTVETQDTGGSVSVAAGVTSAAILTRSITLTERSTVAVFAEVQVTAPAVNIAGHIQVRRGGNIQAQSRFHTENPTAIVRFKTPVFTMVTLEPGTHVFTVTAVSDAGSGAAYTAQHAFLGVNVVSGGGGGGGVALKAVHHALKADTVHYPSSTNTWGAVPGTRRSVAAAAGDWVEFHGGFMWTNQAYNGHADLRVVTATGTLVRKLLPDTATGGYASAYHSPVAGGLYPVATVDDGFVVQASDIQPDGKVYVEMWVSVGHTTLGVYADSGYPGVFRLSNFGIRPLT